MPDNIIQFELPAKPRIKEQEALPDQRKIIVLPFKAIFDKRLNHGTIRTLAAISAYSNRAGITWVSQKRIATELDISQQAVSKQVKQLKEFGYIELVKKGFHGKATDTIRIIYDKDITAAEAITMVSNVEDARPPYQVKQEEKRLHQEVDLEGQKRIAAMLRQAISQPPTLTKKDYQMPKDKESVTVRKMKDEIAKHQRKSLTTKPVDNFHVDNLQVVNVDNLQVVQTTELNTISTTILNNQNLKHLSKNEIKEAFDLLLPIYQSEGLPATDSNMITSILHLKPCPTK